MNHTTLRKLIQESSKSPDLTKDDFTWQVDYTPQLGKSNSASIISSRIITMNNSYWLNSLLVLAPSNKSAKD